jgi:hypothetical protein
VEGRGENAGGAEADEEREEEARGEERCPSPGCGASTRAAGTTGADACRAGNATDGGNGVRVAYVAAMVSAVRVSGTTV